MDPRELTASNKQPCAPSAIVVMGVSGSGKTTLARNLAHALGYDFLEGDDLHPPENIRKMAAGIPLNDEDRWPWLERVGDVLSEARATGVVATCSALKRTYRDLIRTRAGNGIAFVTIMLDHETLRQRLTVRRGHFMPASLLDSQLADFEPPGADEHAVFVDGTLSPDAQLAAALTGLAPLSSAG